MRRTADNHNTQSLDNSGDRFAFTWPPPDPELVYNVAGTGISVYKEMFGALAQDSKSLYSRIAVANSSFSLDPVVGCPAGCAYCVVGSSARDLNIDRESQAGLHIIPTRPRRVFSGGDLVQALVRHPAFIPDKSVVSIGTGSTEAFLPGVEAETWSAIHTLIRLGLRNPVWIVTKLGIRDDLLPRWLMRFEHMRQSRIPLVLSVTYSAAPNWMEPYKGDRFKNMAEVRQAGVRISHHLRPVLRGVNDSRASIALALSASRGIAEVICYGGLRPDPGIKLAWVHVRGLDGSILPEGNDKDTPEGLRNEILSWLHERGEPLPVVGTSSEAIASLLGIPDYNLYRYRSKEEQSFLQVPEDIQQLIKRESDKSLQQIVDEAADRIAIPELHTTVRGADISLGRRLTYQEHRLLIHAIGHSGVMP